MRPITEYGYDTNISLKDANRDDVIKQTLDYYRQRDFVPSSIDFLFSVPTTRGDKNDILTVSDITPNFNGQTSISNHNSNNSSLDAALYRSIPIQYIDIDNNNAIVGNDTIIGITDKDLTVTPFNLSIPKNYVAQNWDKIDYGVVHDKNNRTLVIPVKHKIIGTASNLKENANSGRDYELDRIRNEDFNNLINDIDNTTGFNQHLEIGLNPDDTCYVEILDPSFAHFMNDTDSLTVLDHHGHKYTHNRALKLNERQDHSGAFAKVTYTNLKNASYDGKPISKIEITYSNWKYSPVAFDPFGRGAALYTDSDVAEGFSFEHAKNVDADIKLFDENGKQITFNKESYVTFGSLNSKGKNSDYIESVTLHSQGKGIAIPGSSVSVHNDGKMIYSDYDNDQPEWNPNGFWDVPDPKDPRYHVGAGIFNVTNSDHIKVSYGSGSVNDPNKWNQTGGGFMWATWSTTIPTTNAQYQGYSQNIHIIKDPVQIIEANADDQQSINNAFDKINQDYSNQAKTINDQVTDYVQKMNNYVQKRKAFIQKLKNEGLWQEGMVDPESVKQSFHLNLDSHNNSIVPKVIWYDKNKVKLDSPQQVGFLTDDAIIGAFATVEYTGIRNSYYRNTPITKMTVTYSNVKPGTKSIGSWLTIRTGINNGLSYGHITGLDLDIKFYDENDNQITFDDDAYISIGSLNGYNNEATESVKLLSNGTILPMPQSAVRIHKDGSAYMDDGYVTPASIGLPDSFNSWDNSTDPNRIFGTALVHFQGNHLKLRAFKQMDNVLNTNNSQRTFNGTPWFIWSTMLPPLSFNEPKPELTIHYHNDKLDEHLKRNYSINENLPTPADYNDKYTNVYGNNTNKLNYDLNLSRTEAKDLVTNQKQSASWVLPHFYAQDNQGNIHDLGQGVYSKNPTNGQWGFWNIFDKYQNSQYDVNPNQFLSPAGKGIITLPGYKLITNNDHNSEAATKFDNQSSWIVYNVNGENGISKLENLITNIDLQPTTHVNNIDVIDLDSKNQKSSFADKIKPIYTDTTDSISVADNNLINLDNNLKNYYQRMLENKIIDHIQINDNIIYFNYENGNWSIKSTNWGNLSLTDFEKKAQQEHLNLRNFNLKPVTTSDGTKAGLDSQITVADQNVLSNGQWQTDVPHIQIYVKNKIKRPAEEYDNTDTINHHYIIHYQIPKQIQDDVQYDNGDVYYDIMAHHEYYTYSYLDTNCNYWPDPIYGTLPDGSFGVVGYTDPVPHPEEKWATEDLGWIEDDDPNNNANYIGVDDLLSSDLNNAPFVVDNADTSNIVDNYQLHIYGVNNLGQKIDLTNGSHLITQNGKLYFAPYYNKVNGQKDPYLSTKLDDSEFGNDIWVTYEPLATQRQITYIDIHDYDEPKTLKSYYVTGKEGDQTHLNIIPNTPAGYEIDDDQELPPNDYTFNYETDGNPIIVYVHAKERIDNNVSPFTRHVIFDTTQMAPEDRNEDIYIDWNNDSTSVSSFHNYDKQADADLVFNYKGHINPITNEHIGNWSVTTTNNDNQLLKAGIDPKSKGQELISLLEGSIHVPDGYYAYLDDPSESVTSIPANTLDHLITNSNLIIHIAPIGRNTQIKYVDSLTNETVATGKIITGNLGDKYQTDLTLPDHYSLSKQQTDTNVKITSFTTPQAIITVNKSAQAVIYVNADVIYVDHHNPKKPDDIMITDPDVPEITTNYPVGVDDDYLNKYINETVEFHYPDGSVDSKQQKVHFYRNALINLVTGEITYVDNDRKVLLNDQWAIEGPNNFKDVLIPTKSGMMPKAHIVSGKPGQISLTKISGLTPHVTDDDIKVVIDYSKVNNHKTIVLVDDDATMREITRFNINENTSFDIPDGYLLAHSYNNDERNEIMNGDWDSLSNATNNGNPDLITIHLIENMKNITDTDAKAHLNIKRQVVIVNPDNTRDSMTMTIELERQAIYNEVTKKISYGNWYVKQIPVTTYDHTLDNGEDEDSGIESFDLYNYKYDEKLDNPSAVNTQILKYFGDYENVNNFIKQLNAHTELIIPAIHIPDKAGYAKEIDNANTDGINISNEYIPAEHLLLVNDQNEKDQLGTETRDLSIINIDDHNFDEDLDKTIVVHYIQGQHEMSYHYIDQITGQIVGGDSVLGDEGQTVDITNTIPNGYHLVNGQHNFANTYTFDNKNNVTQTVYVAKD